MGFISDGVLEMSDKENKDELYLILYNMDKHDLCLKFLQLTTKSMGYKKQLSDLQEKYDRAVEVVEFYGNKEQMHEKLISFGGSFSYRGDDWELLGTDDSYKSIIFHGKLAREFLKSIEGKNGPKS